MLQRTFCNISFSYFSWLFVYLDCYTWSPSIFTGILGFDINSVGHVLPHWPWVLLCFCGLLGWIWCSFPYFRCLGLDSLVLHWICWLCHWLTYSLECGSGKILCFGDGSVYIGKLFANDCSYVFGYSLSRKKHRNLSPTGNNGGWLWHFFGGPQMWAYSPIHLKLSGS